MTLMTVACAPNQANSKTFDVVDSSRSLEIVGQIDGEIVGQAEKLINMSKTPEPVYMLINSPGGQVLPGMIFVDAMHTAKKRGVKIVCVSNVMAASMAFVILAHCDERYARPNTRLLFHPMSISTSGSRIQELVTDLNETVKEEKRIARELQRIMRLEWKDFHPHYFAETFWSAEQLSIHSPGFIRLVDEVRGYDKNLYRIVKQRGLFGQAKRVMEKFFGSGGFTIVE